MDLFNQLKLATDCQLCGCTVEPSTVEPQNQAKDNQPSPLLPKSPLICDYCHQRLPISHNNCFVCGLPLHKILHDSSKNQQNKLDTPCGECLKNSPTFNRTISAFHYENPVNRLIAQLKYSSQLHVLPLLCEYLIREIIEQYQSNPLPSLIIPTPLHANKLTKRGFNQSYLIAKQLTKTLEIKIASSGIKRIKNTQAQSGLDSIERKSNVKNAFRINFELPNHVALVDDVVTTGTTISELAKQAKKHGAKKVDVWCLARAYE